MSNEETSTGSTEPTGEVEEHSSPPPASPAPPTTGLATPAPADTVTAVETAVEDSVCGICGDIIHAGEAVLSHALGFLVHKNGACEHQGKAV